MDTVSVYRKGFGLARDIAPDLARDYHSALVRWFRENDFILRQDRTTVRLARELGFCYGVDRAVEYAYETRRHFPDRNIHITGEIIHNPHVNSNLRKMGINFLSTPEDLKIDPTAVHPGDVVILPAFGARPEDLELFRKRGAVLVDTTCGSVLNVWKNVLRNARDGFTSVIHGKYLHEETRATASWATGTDSRGHYLVVRDMNEAEMVCRHIEKGGDREPLLAQFGPASSSGFDPDCHLERIGVANQTTMLSSESMAIARRLGEALAERWGEAALTDHFRSFDTICSATQERQDAVVDLLGHDLDVLVVIGGYNSSNTNHLAEMALSTRTRPYHIEGPDSLRDDGSIAYQPVSSDQEIVETGWLSDGPAQIGVTAGASTPNNRIGEVLARVLRLRGLESPVVEA